MATRISKAEHEYPFGHPRKVGETFEVDDKDVEVLLALGRIEPDDGARQSYNTRDMAATRSKRVQNRKVA